MRRQTTKQPRGPATRARPTPAMIARVKKSSSIAGPLPFFLPGGGCVCARGSTAVGDRAVGMEHSAIGEMGVIVLMTIDRQRLSSACSEEAQIFRAIQYVLRCAAAAYVTVQTDYRIRVGH